MKEQTGNFSQMYKHVLLEILLTLIFHHFAKGNNLRDYEMNRQYLLSFR